MKIKTFNGFERSDGSIGTRNYVAVIPTVFCANEVVAEVAGRDAAVLPLLHNKGCGQLSPDLQTISRTLIGLSLNPNVGAVLLVGLGCEAISIEEVHAAIAGEGKWVEKIVIQEAGGMKAAVTQGQEIVARMKSTISQAERRPHPISKICLAVKCGSSDATSGIAANPATGRTVDTLMAEGATVVFGETTEFIGAEHILARRGVCPQVSEDILKLVANTEKRIVSMGVDMRGTQPSRGNMAGGLTTIEEKSLGAISKSGGCPIEAVYPYGTRIRRPGLFIMDSPGKEDEFLTGVAAAGANVIVFTTGGGAPQGFPLVPVIKVAGNSEMIKLMGEHIDVDASSIIHATQTIGDVGKTIVETVYEVASGRSTRAEKIRYDRTIGIYTLGPTI